MEAISELFSGDFLKAMTEPARVELVKQLMLQGPMDVGSLAELVPQERSVVSRHLKVLVAVGVVRVEQDGKHRVYSLDGPRMLEELEAIVSACKTLTPVCCP